MIFSKDVGKVFENVYHAFMMKVLERDGLSGAYHNIICTVFDKSLANSMLKGGRLEARPLKSGIRWICSLS